jgi:hypothetical protein
MPSESTPVSLRFVPSAALARLALQATEQATGGVRVWVSSVPDAEFIDEAALFAPPPDRVDATPDTLPKGDDRDVVERVQNTLGTRVERLLSNFAFEAAARKERKFPITQGQEFTPPVFERLLQTLPIPRSQAPAVFSRLAEELRQAARNRLLGGDWGWLCEEPPELVLEISAPLERLPADRPRARVIGGIAKDR